MGGFNFGNMGQSRGNSGRNMQNAALVAGLPGSHGDAYARAGRHNFDQQSGALQEQMDMQRQQAQAEGLGKLVESFAKIHKHAVDMQVHAQKLNPQDQQGEAFNASRNRQQGGPGMGAQPAGRMPVFHETTDAFLKRIYQEHGLGDYGRPDSMGA